jgi:hypothetical protein
VGCGPFPHFHFRFMVEPPGGGAVLPGNATDDGAANDDAAEKTMTTITHTTAMAPPPVSAAARRPHQGDPQDGADQAKRGDGYAERADDAGGTARPTAPVMAFPSFAEEVRRRARVQRGSRAAARALARRAQGGRALAGARADAGSTCRMGRAVHRFSCSSASWSARAFSPCSTATCRRGSKVRRPS